MDKHWAKIVLRRWHGPARRRAAQLLRLAALLDACAPLLRGWATAYARQGEHLRAYVVRGPEPEAQVAELAARTLFEVRR